MASSSSLFNYQVSFEVVSPKLCVLLMTPTDNVGTPESLIGDGDMSVESFTNMVASDEDTSRLVT